MSQDLPRVSDAAVRHLRETIDHPDVGERFVVKALIGQGGMGRVYAVHDQRLDRDVALKVLSLDAETEELSARLVRESRVLARLEHPGIAAIHDAGTLSDGRPYYLMRLVRGATLAAPSVRTTRGERLRIFLRICDAVAYAHARGVVHRDIKPGNVMVGEYGDVVVLDWGVAKVLAAAGDHSLANATEDDVVVGTPGYMAPEQAAGAGTRVDVRADVYGLGTLLRHLLSLDTTDAGSPSFVDAVASPSWQANRPLAAIVAHATSSDPGDRYPSVDGLAADVRRWLDGESVSAYREMWVERVARFYTRNRTLLWLLAAYAFVRVTILLWRGV